MRRFVVAAAVAKAAVVIVAVATDPCGPLRRSWREAFRPVRTSARSLIIGAGEGSAGSRSLIQWIANATFRPTTVGHWLRTYPPQSTAGPAYRRAVRAIAALRPQDHASFDYTVFDHATAVGAILDTPVPQFFPYIFQSYPNARVILAVRNASDWVRRRREVHKVRAVRPFAVLDKPLLTAAGRWNPSRLRPDAIGDVLAYEAHNLLVRCLVPPAQLLEINLFEEADDAVRERITRFIGG